MRALTVRRCLLPLLVVLPGLAGSQTVLTDFSTTAVGQTPAGWKLRGTNGGVSRFTVQEAPGPQGPERYGLLEYSFGGAANPGGWLAGAGRKTCILGCWLPIPADHWVLEVDVEGDGSGHGLVLSVGEPNAEWFDYDLGRVDFTGRKTLRLDLRTGWRSHAGRRANGQLDPPLWMASLNLEQSPGGPLTGKVSLYAVRALSGPPQGLAATSVEWLRPAAGAFATDEAPAFHARVKNLGAQAVYASARWHVSAGTDAVKETQDKVSLPPGGEELVSLSLGEVPIGYYDADLVFVSGEESRTFRASVAVIPPPHPDPALRLGAGEAYPGFAATQEFADWVGTLHSLGASWTLVHLPFVTFDPEGATPNLESQCAVIKAAADHEVALVASLGNLPPDLVNANTNEAVVPLEQVVQRYEAAMSVAAGKLRGLVSRWCLLHLDWSFFPPNAADPLPQPDYAQYLTRVRAKIAEADPKAGFIAALVDRSVARWEAHGGPNWPPEVDFLTERVYYAGSGFGETHHAAEEIVRRKADGKIGGELWLKSLCPAKVEGPGWEPGRQWAEGVVVKVVESVHAAPAAHILYTVGPADQEEGGVLDHQGNVTAPGVAFALCADLLNGAQPAGDLTTSTCRGYLFRCEAGTLAVLWPLPLESEQTVALQAEGPVEHYGATQRHPDVPATATQTTLQPGVNLLRGRFTLKP